ncbi:MULTISPECIES: M48 family metalloprotease [unclassified Bradyrhizobium]|uniref:M48 family metalloprotease n=1 Tax=unclassified Bradyrhizobium TaxID=2631580 RepID=UPI001CD53A88|nr:MULTISPECIES: M48 family metalloprotease [unclassified Bradyrhizobium]MCA1375833.1 M48 family metalloprotease [Bradyrhizobium sp. IC4060]MCA1485571.1 M48 family metalloprotease [Bradyrhizobium sp. IC4061]
MDDYSRLARLEWFQTICFNFPVQIILPFVVLFQRPGLFIPVLISMGAQLAALLALYFALATVVSLMVNLFRARLSGVKADTIPRLQLWKLSAALASNHAIRQLLSVSSFRVNKTDLIMGAHVRGIFHPSIALSAGLLIGLIRKDQKAYSILAHELAHIKHFDLFLPGFVGLAIFEILGTAFQLSLLSLSHPNDVTPPSVLLVVLYKVLILGGLVSLISRNREFYADATALSVTRNVDEYVGLLAKASEHERSRLSYFHPSLRRRIAEVQNNFQVLRRAVGWRVYIGLASLVAFIQWKALQDSETDSRYFFCGFLMGLFILFTEMFRGMLLPRASLGSVPLVNSAEEGPVFSEKFTWNEQKPNKALNTIFRYAFLIGGFILATILGANFPNPHVVIPILGALVYGTFRALK